VSVTTSFPNRRSSDLAQGRRRRESRKTGAFLQEYEDRSVMIEGNTDNVGSEESNFDLSQRRADSVQSYLISRGSGPVVSPPRVRSEEHTSELQSRENL